MFRNRRTSQKPSDDLYRNFKANFPQLGIGQQHPTTSEQVAPGATSLSDALDGPLRPVDDTANQPHDMKDVVAESDPTPKPNNEPWSFGSSGLTPSFMDPNSNGFSMFTNHMPGYYTPTPGGTNTIYHPQAGDLHTPTFHMGIGTPLSLPTSEGALHAGQQVAAFHGFHPQLAPQMGHPPFQNVNPFQMHQTHPQAPPQTFAPPPFHHQQSFEGPPLDDSPLGDLTMDMDAAHNSQHQSPEMLMHPQSFHHSMPPPSSFHPIGDKFRYHATLNAPTAMIKHTDDIPITYLNKGQAYTLNVVDTQLQQPIAPLKYRTFVRVSFEDEQQRQKPAACWQLWKEGRGTNEAHQRGGRLQAVEYVETTPAMGAEDPSKPRIELESASFDGFCVTWTPAAGMTECPISVRFNFLSTDFSHSKGVKGIPVRLCAKTEILTDLSSAGQSSAGPEVCYCKVKLFRDHGAERKLSNDVQHVKKTIDKLNQQIAQIESGMRDGGKRKRSGSIAKGTLERPGKMPKHRRTWSMSSVTSGGRGGVEEDLHTKLMNLQDMFSSTRPASILFLRGAEQDDPDLHPVKITGEHDLVRTESAEPSAWERQSTAAGDDSMVSPTPSSQSLAGSRRGSTLQQPTPVAALSRDNSSEWRNNQQTATADITGAAPKQLASPPDTKPMKVQTRSPNSGALSGWVEAVGVDPSYNPPPERAVKPVACFYVQPRVASKPSSDSLHRAVYVMDRTLKSFVNALATKCDIEPTKVLRTVRISRKGLHVLFDDDCVRELPEGQDMTAEINEITDSPGVISREWDAADVQCDGDITSLHNISSSGYELRLLF